MIKIKYLCLFLLMLCCINPACSISTGDITNAIFSDNPLEVGSEEKEYPEDRKKVINVTKKKSPLKEKGAKIPKILKAPYENMEEYKSHFSFGAANIFSIGTGVVDVTYQVKNGVEHALKNTFDGYAEHQRRKMTEEILNANYASSVLTSRFLLGSVKTSGLQVSKDIGIYKSPIEYIDDLDLIDVSFLPRSSVDILGILDGGDSSEDKFNDFIKKKLQPLRSFKGLINVATHITNKPLIDDIHKGFKNIATVLLLLMITLMIFTRLSHNSFSLNYVISEPLFTCIVVWLLIGVSQDLVNIVLYFFKTLNNAIHMIIKDYFSFNSYNEAFEELHESWRSLSNTIGYFPAIFMSVVNLIAQAITYFYIAGLILHVVVAKILSPIWILAGASKTLRSSSFNSFVNWLKTLASLVLIPIIYLIIVFITKEFRSLHIPLLDISLSVSAMLFLPFISGALFAQGSGVFQSMFSGYELIVDTLNSSFYKLYNLIEVNNKSDYGSADIKSENRQFHHSQYKESHNSASSPNFNSQYMTQAPVNQIARNIEQANSRIKELLRQISTGNVATNLDKIIRVLKQTDGYFA